MGFTHYYPLGMEYVDEGIRNMNSNERFTGHEFQPQHGLNWHDMGWRPYDGTTGITPTIDRIAEDYYWISPYIYCANNPVRFIDPDGMDIYFINEDGEMSLALKREDKEDQLVATQKDQYGYTQITNKSIRVKDKKLLPQLKGDKEDGPRYGTTQNGNDAFNVFHFAADHSNVEWSLSGFKENGRTSFSLGTIYDSGWSNTGEGALFDAQDFIFNVHSHPNKIDGTLGGSGGSRIHKLDGNKIGYDRYTDMGYINRLYKKIGTGYGPSMYVYHRGTRNIYQYTPWNPSILKGKNIQSGKKLKQSIYP